ncbi:hypothetical protein BKA08_001291 [Nocardioides marinisabuli]|uniref:site-specific DNA-methyltransferase (adenine-specific) n=1 Tax=Nocardioides marinisabuli TaxID=419476 RepID=A0A7Y9JQX2_9ACTN|nr:N-6 DNA methylase [Nocardioides marinisabuli]NYD57053.1 hypothetical protein [Nocardioides marinisabuli]
MLNEPQRRADIRTTLQAAGYSVIQFEPAIGSTNDFRPDVIAFAADSHGNLIPRVAIEVKSGVAMKRPEFVLPALARSRELLGTTEHYAVIGDQWYRADRGLRSVERVPGPDPLDDTGVGSGFVTDLSLATSLLLDRLRAEAGDRRGRESTTTFPPADIMAETLLPGVETVSGDFVPVDHKVLWQARRQALVEFASGARSTSAHVSDSLIAQAVAHLIGSRLDGTVLDPFCGTGSFLWAALDRAVQIEGPVEFVGVEREPDLAELAGHIALSAPMPATVTCDDAFSTELPEAQAVVSAPPIGGRMQGERHSLLTGDQTSETELAALDACIRTLAPGGRAVLHLPIGVTFKRGVHERYRDFLSNECRVAALIGLPPGALEGTQIRSLLLVVDRDQPGDTFVAQLGADWRTQLEKDGAALQAALEHVDDSSRG